MARLGQWGNGRLMRDRTAGTAVAHGESLIAWEQGHGLYETYAAREFRMA